MGCDIHIIIESRWGTSWNAVVSRLYEPRDYELFGRMANGIRGFRGPIEPRGLPKDICPITEQEYCMMVVDTDKCDYDTIMNWAENAIPKDKADEWVEKGLSEYMYGNLLVTGPDYHSASWLTFREFKEAVDDVEAREEYYAMVAYMETLEKMGRETRVVFWFDN